MIVWNQNYMHEEIKIRLNSINDCNHAIQNGSFSHLLSTITNVKIKVHSTIRSVPGGKVNIQGGHSIGHSKKKVYMKKWPVPNLFRYLGCNIFLPSHCNAPLSKACESVWSISWLLWFLLIGPVILEDCMTGQNSQDVDKMNYQNN
jgi:hypothetical protein